MGASTDWKVLPLDGKYYGTRVSLGGDATVEVWSSRSWKPSPREEQDPDMRDSSHFENKADYADALLIAAAPDLLTALEEILARFDDNDLKLTVDAIQISATTGALAANCQRTSRRRLWFRET